MGRSVRTGVAIILLALVLATTFLAGTFLAGGAATGGWQHIGACDGGPTNSC